MSFTLKGRMNNLIEKYRKDKLTPEELSELRKRASSLDDDEIEKYLYNAWLQDDIDTSFIDDKRMDKIKDDIQSGIEKKRSVLSIVIRWSQIAAAILLPIFIVFTVYLYRQNALIISDEMVIATETGERATINLPDGSSVTLNSESKLVYLPQDYNRKERKISFNGEGYFQVKQSDKVPFFVNAKGLQVKVLGTTFNLSVRDNNDTAELSLEKGKVSILSTLTNENVILEKNQKAILEHSTGNITVISDENIMDLSAWKRGDVIFRNIKLLQIIQTIEENYNITIKVDCEHCLEDTFTGTMPTNDLNEVLAIIEQSYHLKAVINGKEIILSF